MTASSSASTVVQASSGNSSTANHGKQNKSQKLQQNQPTTGVQSATAAASSSSPSIQASCPSFNSSAAFQQVKQTQASLARLCRVHQQQSQQNQQHQNSGLGQSNPSSQQQQLAKISLDSTTGQLQQQQQQQSQHQKPTTFVDCLIRRFENCFDEDFCAVPMFVVGGLSPGSDGTHLILPPCVSLGGQNINRFSSPKNLRLMNSIRESCRSIEELDLGRNKLTDLIEVYKILQCTPNLRFLNLSENDLSRSSPVAMATQSPSSSTAIASSSSSLTTTAIGSPSSSSSTTTPTMITSVHLNSSSTQQRAYLAPINQNHQQQQTGSLLGARRYSSLGQSTTNPRSTPGGGVRQSTRLSATSASSSSSSSSSSSTSNARTRPSVSRVAEARRLAAANALAQSKKTSSHVASKLANSAAAGGSLTRQASGSCRTLAARCEDSSSLLLGKQTRAAASQRMQANSPSTMHLARSLSSLSAKDIRLATANGTSGRLAAAHRSSLRNESRSLAGAASRRSSFGSSTTTRQEVQKVASSSPLSSSSSSSSAVGRDMKTSSRKITTSTSHQKLYAEPIVENEDVEMTGGEQQLSGSFNPASDLSGTCSNQAQIITATSNNNNSPSTSNQHQQQLQSKTGNQSLRSYCNSHSSLLGLTSQQQSITMTTKTNFLRTFESVKALALNNTGCQWKVVCSILSRMPNLEELHLSLNNYEKIDLDTNQFKHHTLKRLYLCNNPKLTNWEELDKLLIAFPSLEALSIADCNISQIPDNLDRAREWRKLCGLNINGWPIKEWPVVERLNQLPSLIDLRCRNLAVLNSIDEPRPHLIARLPKLLRLNGSEIEEREDAEKAFLRFYLVNAHLERPPRFHELMQVYGEVPHIDVDVDLSPPSQASIKIIYLNRNHYRKADEDDVLMSEDFLLKLMDDIEANNPLAVGGSAQENMDTENGTSSTTALAPVVQENGPVRLFKDEGQEVVALDVDLRQSVRKFKSTIASLFGMDSQNLILYYIDHEMVGLMGPELIKHNQKKLWNYNVRDGDQFIVEDR